MHASSARSASTRTRTPLKRDLVRSYISTIWPSCGWNWLMPGLWTVSYRGTGGGENFNRDRLHRRQGQGGFTRSLRGGIDRIAALYILANTSPMADRFRGCRLALG